MKRLVVLALCLMVVASGAFALDKAVGGGLLFNASFTNGSASETYTNTYYNGYTMVTDTYNLKYDWTMSRTGFGAFGFFGLGRFFELNLGVLYKNPNEIKVKFDDGETETLKGSDISIEASAALQLGVYGKYPIPISDTFVFFPTIGADFEISLSGEEWNGWKWWHDLWLRGGVGLDIFFSEKLFLRTHAIYGAAIPVGGIDDLGLKFGHGFLLKAGVGWMF